MPRRLKSLQGKRSDRGNEFSDVVQMRLTSKLVELWMSGATTSDRLCGEGTQVAKGEEEATLIDNVINFGKISVNIR